MCFAGELCVLAIGRRGAVETGVAHTVKIVCPVGVDVACRQCFFAKFGGSGGGFRREGVETSLDTAVRTSLHQNCDDCERDR